MNGWEKMLESWPKTYYDDPFMFVCELTAIILGIIYQRKNRIGQFFICYAILDISILIFDYYLLYFSNLSRKEFSYSLLFTNSISFLGEILAYLFFFQLTLKNKLIKRAIPFLRLIFIVLLLFHFLNALLFHIPIAGINDMYYLGVIEFFFLIAPCFFYFAELFSRPSPISLFRRPSFWITTGIFFYTFISIPYYFITDYLDKSKYQYQGELAVLFFALPYGLTFLFLSKAFLCKTELTT
jgi:hypothetical protein